MSAPTATTPPRRDDVVDGALAARPPAASPRSRPALALTLGAVLVLDLLVTLEWSFPYCDAQYDGPASAVFGAPLPYERWSGISSLEYVFMPHVYLLDVALLGALAYPIVRRLLARASPGLASALGGLGVALALVAGALRVGEVALGLWIPVASIASSYDPYADLRPVGVAPRRHYECTPTMPRSPR